MQRARILVLILIAAAFVVGCNPPVENKPAPVTGQTMTPDGKKSGGAGQVKVEN